MSEPENRAAGIFANHALRLRAHGLAVLPTDGKRPLVRYWNRWRRPPSVEAIARYVQQFPVANVGIVPGVSNLLVADVDTADQVGEVEKLFGPTPLHVKSSRGEHLYYRDTAARVQLPGNLKALGLNVDLKAGNSIVIAPPSLHESGATYRHVDCDWCDLGRLPQFNRDRLRKFLASTPSEPSVRYVEGERGLGLNRLLCRHVIFTDSFDELLDVARTLNSDFLPPLDDAEVIKRARAVWTDMEAGKLERWEGLRAVAKTRASEITQLCLTGRKGADGLTLLLFLRTQHAARCRRGETFAIAAEAMQRQQTIPNWNSKRISFARDLLIRCGHLIRVSPPQFTSHGPLPAQYRLVESNAD